MDPFLDFFIFVLAGVGGSLFFLVPAWGPQLVFLRLTQPPRKTAGLPSGIPGDAWILTVYLAVPNAVYVLLLLCLLPSGDMTLGLVALAPMIVCTNLLIALSWFNCQRFLWKHRILQPRSRLLVQLILYPSAVAVVSEIASTSLLLLISAWEWDKPGSFEGFLVAFVISGLSWIVLFLLRYLFHRFVTQDPQPNLKQDSA